MDHLKNRGVSERRGCRLTGFSRSAAWYPLKGRDVADPRARHKALAECYPHYGYPTLHDMLRRECLVQNPKCTNRIYREEGLQVVDISISGQRLARELTGWSSVDRYPRPSSATTGRI